MGAHSRIAAPDWPRLMAEPEAARYLSIGTTMLRMHGPRPKRLGRRVLYDRHDLDCWADRLLEQPSQPALDGLPQGEPNDMGARIRARLNGTG